MDSLFKYIEKYKNETKEALSKIYNKDRYIFCYFNLKIIEVKFKYTNEKSQQRKETTKYFIGDFQLGDTKNFSPFFIDWINSENSKRKNKLLNPKIVTAKNISSVIFFGDEVKLNNFTMKNTEYIKSDICSFLKDKNIKNILNLFNYVPSQNIKDYVVCCDLNIDLYLSNVRYSTKNNNIKEKTKAFIQITNNLNKGVSLFSSKYPEGMASRSISLANKKEPYRAIQFIDWDITNHYQVPLGA